MIDLTPTQCDALVDTIISGENQQEVATMLMRLHEKGETALELQAFVQAMKKHMIAVPYDGDLLDIVGTGGDNANTVNISTAASLLAACCGAKVVKHGNRSVSSQCGSADLLEALGFHLDSTPTQVLEDLSRTGFAFCFSPNFHPAMKAVKAVRKALGFRTIFNLLGPLLNPANANCYVMGVFSEKYLELFADTLIQLKVKHAMVVHSNGLDELTLLGPSEVVEVKNGKKKKYTLDPKRFGFSYCQLADIQGGDASYNAVLIEKALSGEAGPIADTIILNAAAGLYVAGLASTIELGIEIARSQLQSGKTLQSFR